LILAFLSLGMFGIGFLRGDYAVMIGSLRADQWLDGGLLALSLWQARQSFLSTDARN
jgi:hypothetical protein